MLKEHHLLTKVRFGSLTIVVPKIDGKDQVCVERASLGLGGGHQIAESRQCTGGSCQHQSFDPHRRIINGSISSRVDRFCLNIHVSGRIHNHTFIHRVALEKEGAGF